MKKKKTICTAILGVNNLKPSKSNKMVLPLRVLLMLTVRTSKI